MFNKILTTFFVLTAIATVFMYANVVEAQQVIADGLVSYWTFDENTIDGDTVRDIWGDNDGTIMGDPEIVEGKYGEALSFDGVDDWVGGTGDSPTLDNTEAFTYEAWVKPDLVDVGRIFLGNAVDNFEFDARNGLSLYIRNGGWGTPVQSGAGTVPAGEWSHVVGTFDGDEIKVYLNGALEATVQRDITLVSGDFSVNFGTFANGEEEGGWFYDGILDEARAYNRALSEEEIEHNMSAAGLAVANYADKLTLTWGEIRGETGIWER